MSISFMATDFQCKSHAPIRDHTFITFLSFLNPLVHIRTRAYQEFRNDSFSEDFAYILNG